MVWIQGGMFAIRSATWTASATHTPPSLAGRKRLGLAWRVAQCARVMRAFVVISWAEIWICSRGACTKDQPGGSQCHDCNPLHDDFLSTP